MPASAIASFENPADLSKTIHLREATVQEAFTFSGLNPESDEVLLTAFLDAIQEPEKHTDPKQWTAQTRLFALYWYGINTLDDTVKTYVYDCGHCGKKHSHKVDLKDFAAEVKGIEGKSFREVTINDQLIQVRPLTGEAMESLEVLRLGLSAEEDANGNAIELTEDQINQNRVVRAQLRFKRILLSINFPNDLEPNIEKRDKAKETTVASMAFSDYEKLVNSVDNLQGSMDHGLPAIINNEGELSIPFTAKCKEGPGTTNLGIRFHHEFSLPMV